MTPENEIFSDFIVPAEPGVIKWFKVYCGFSCFLNFGGVLVAWWFFLVPPEGMSAREADTTGVFILAASLFAMAAYALPFCVEWRRWVWVYGLVLICFGMSSACLLLVCVPLLISWIKPETKSYFARLDQALVDAKS